MAWSAPAPQPVIHAPPRKLAPAALPPLSSVFGWRHHPIRGTYKLHSGIDIPGRLGTPVMASASGLVRFAGRAGGYGNMIEIDHGNGLETRYAHLSALLVRAGTPVTAGETIALMGSTGLSTGSHLHFEVRRDGRAANPLAYLRGAAALAAPRTMALSSGPEPAGPHVSHFAKATTMPENTAPEAGR